MNRYFCLSLVFFIAFAGLYHDSVFGADPSREDMLVFDLGKIEVVGAEVRAETNAVTTVDTETFDAELKEDVVDVARRLPGITVTVGNKNEPQIMLRGFSQKYLTILYDGVPMASPYYSDVDSSELPLDNIAEMKFVRGNASVLYGPNAMGGALSLVSAKPGPNPNLNLLASVDQEGNLVTRLGHGRKIDNYYYQLSAGYRKSDGWRLSDDFEATYDKDGNPLENGGIRENSHYEQWSIGAKGGREWDRGELTLSFNYQDADKGIPPTTNPADKVRYWDFTEWKKYSAILAGRQKLGEKGELRGNVFYHKYDNTLEVFKDVKRTMVDWISKYDDWSAGAVLRTAWALQDNFDLRAAFNGVYDFHSAQDDVGDPWEEYTSMTTSFAVEAEWLAHEMLNLQIGAAYEQYNFDDYKNVEGKASSIAARTKDVDSFGFNLLATVPLDEMNEITLGVGRKNRFPNMHELFSNIKDFEPEDVTTLNSEVSMQYTLGYTMKHDVFDLGISGFYYDVDDKILRPNNDSLFGNIEKATYKGVELWGAFGETVGVFGSMSYTYQETENKSPGQPSQSLPYVPKHHLHVDLGYGFDCGTRVTLGNTYRGSAIQYAKSGDPVDVPSYTLWDLTIRHDFDFGLGITLQGTNLLDENYYQEIGFEQPGRNIKLGLQYKI